MKIETKYNIGDIVFFINNFGHIKSDKIKNISINNNNHTLWYTMYKYEGDLNENKLFIYPEDAILNKNNNILENKEEELNVLLKKIESLKNKIQENDDFNNIIENIYKDMNNKEILKKLKGRVSKSYIKDNKLIRKVDGIEVIQIYEYCYDNTGKKYKVHNYDEVVKTNRLCNLYRILRNDGYTIEEIRSM